MKKFKQIAYILLIAIVVILSLTIYTNANKNNDETEKEKVFSQIKYLETKLINLFNTMNNIKTTDYNIITTEISGETTENTSQGGSQGEGQSQSSGGESSKSSDSGKSGESSGSSGSSDSQSEGKKEQNQKMFELKSTDVLTSKEEINWDSIKSEVENIYSDLPSIIMDFYQLNTINQEDILNFNKEYDNLTVIVQEENKENTLAQLSKIYDYLPKFLKSSSQEELYTTIIETKANILKGYAKIDGEKWDEISNDIKAAIESYSKLLTNTNVPATKQSKISKGYIMINELQNAVNVQDKAVFLIKYKNLLEELSRM